MKAAPRALLIAALVLAAVFAAWLWRSMSTTPGVAPAPNTPVAVAPPPASQAAPAEVPAASAAPEPPLPTLPPLAANDVNGALGDLVGKPALAQWQTDQFPRRVAATVDNLGRSHAPVSLWPVTPTPGRFTVVEQNGASFIAPGNYDRYTPFVTMIEGIDATQAAQLYARLSPLLQGAYAQLGYPNAKFHQRLLDVIDQLLATPDVKPPVKVELTEVKGPIPSTRPWVRYEFADPTLRNLPAGQQAMIRMGPENARRVKAKLTALRAQVLRVTPGG